MQDDLGYGDLLDEAFYSYELRVAKPDPAYFTTILGRLDESRAARALPR